MWSSPSTRTHLLLVSSTNQCKEEDNRLQFQLKTSLTSSSKKSSQALLFLMISSICFRFMAPRQTTKGSLTDSHSKETLKRWWSKDLGSKAASTSNLSLQLQPRACSKIMQLKRGSQAPRASSAHFSQLMPCQIQWAVLVLQWSKRAWITKLSLSSVLKSRENQTRWFPRSSLSKLSNLLEPSSERMKRMNLRPSLEIIKPRRERSQLCSSLSL